MTQEPTEDLEDEQTEGEGHNLRRLREKADRTDKAELEAAALARENAFLKAGIDTESPLGSMFAKAYDGPLEAEAVRDAYGKITTVASPEPESTSEPAPAEAAMTREREALVAGGEGDTGEVPSKPIGGRQGRAVEIFEKAVADGSPRDEAAGYAFAAIVEAAADGDTSVVIPPGGREP